MNPFFQKEILIENKFVRIVPFTIDYKPLLSGVVFDKDIWTYMGMVIETDSDLHEYITSTTNDRRNGISYPFLVIDQITNKIAGSTRFGNIHFANKRLEIGWTWFGKDFRGTGINRACKYELLKYAFEFMGFNRVQFSADIDNKRSQRAILKLGAKQEGIFRSNYIDHKGETRDDVYFSIIKSEWDQVKEKYFSDLHK